MPWSNPEHSEDFRGFVSIATWTFVRLFTCPGNFGFDMSCWLAVFFLGFIALGSTSGQSCRSVCIRRGTVSCSLRNETVSCASNPPSGSVADFQCRDFYLLEGKKSITCLTNGTWSSPQPRCTLNCGKQHPVVTLVVNGVTSTPGAFPWHVAIYNFLDDSYEYWCGGSVISEHAVITAAHCTWQIAPEKLLLVFGKFRRELNFEENNVQKIKAKRIEMLESYQDVAGNYNGDIAVIFLEKPVQFDHLVAPICIDWNQEFMDKQLATGTLGVAVGWGLTENDTFSDSLRVSALPVTSDEQCIAQQPQDFQKFVTYTSFCAGFGNGTGVCNGDSGGGLVFLHKPSDSWYLQGLVSVSPRRKGTPYCDPHFRTVFTKVSMFAKWLRYIKHTEEEMISHSEAGCSKAGKSDTKQKLKDKEKKMKKHTYSNIKKYFNRPMFVASGKKFLFPHSDKILESAGLLRGVTPEE